MLTRTTLYNSDLYQITAIVFDNGRFEVVEVIRIPLVGRPTLVFLNTLPTDLKERLLNLIRNK